MDDEIWKDIVALDGCYQASNMGRIRNKKTKRIKALIFDGHYYKFGYDYSINKVRKRGWYRVHKAVAETFIENPENKPTVNHIDGDKSNNSVQNLEWATHKEQSVHATNVLKKNCGESNYNAQYTNDQVLEMRNLYESGCDLDLLKEMFGGRKSNIRRIVKYERWKNI